MSMTNTVRLWLLNDEGLYLETQRLTLEALENAINGAKDAVSARAEARDELSNTLQDLVQEAAPVAEGLWRELIRDVLNTVDFDSLAKEELDERPIFFISGSDGFESELYLDDDDAKSFLEGLPSCVVHEKAHEIAAMKSGDMIEIEGVKYTLYKA